MRLLGVNIPDEKRVEIALTYLYGLGFSSSRKMLMDLKINLGKKAKELSPDELNKIQNYIEKSFSVEGNLRQLVRRNIQMLRDLGTYRGSRHARRLPTRGQRTKTNSRTVRGNQRKTAGSGKRKVELK